MSVLVDFSIDSGDFLLGNVLRGPEEMHFELERIVPTGDAVMPFVWATGGDFEAFEANVKRSERVRELRALDKVGERALYRIVWEEPHAGLIEVLGETEATILEARGDGAVWRFRLRFSDHDKLSTFYNRCTENDFPVHIDRTYTLSEDIDGGHRLGLSAEQREALVLALERGYFDTPSGASLSVLSDELDISQQSLSDRIRRGNEQVLRSVLLSSAADFD
ncbi:MULTISPECIES: bacterio-opsin activator domain-containing protein [Halorussus]|uniref:helix-turn-helix domain-containing protein n=1 Tax=Halorussus TaxID=1070314 RepID=UPI000E218B5A|nr:MULTISPECIES: bacterio-opsin activator domain-containing protein [Halorussus]NHN61440.1 bacterio-opsin activator [Halorussus sp. JP-T4]